MVREERLVVIRDGCGSGGGGLSYGNGGSCGGSDGGGCVNSGDGGAEGRRKSMKKRNMKTK